MSFSPCVQQCLLLTVTRSGKQIMKELAGINQLKLDLADLTSEDAMSLQKSLKSHDKVMKASLKKSEPW